MVSTPFTVNESKQNQLQEVETTLRRVKIIFIYFFIVANCGQYCYTFITCVVTVLLAVFKSDRVVTEPIIGDGSFAVQLKCEWYIH